ncbi:MAG: hypothetical protein C0605_06405 [Hyphomicrobiales bacterium]|nr:MAG: hypothetical protein C0605_06405 [Hyphomicrobiales bacterium]
MIINRPACLLFSSLLIWILIVAAHGGPAFAANRVFNLHLENRTKAPVTFLVSPAYHNCYEGSPGIGAKMGPVRPGRRVTMTIARIQGHGCDGEQGVFAVRPLGRTQLQKFSFNNEGGLILTNAPDEYSAHLSAKNRTDGSFRWLMQDPDPNIPTAKFERENSRQFDLHLVNRTGKPRTFWLLPGHHNCYEGIPRITPGRPVAMGPVPPGGRYTMKLARIQGHGCNGKQGEFAVLPRGLAHMQRFSFDNAGHLGLINVPQHYVGHLGKKSTYDESYSWTVYKNSPQVEKLRPDITLPSIGRRISLHLKNWTHQPVTFTISPKNHNCYEGEPKIGTSIGPIARSRIAVLKLARKQGGDCDGKQGVFSVEISGRRQLQIFNFDNKGYLNLSNEPDEYDGRLGPRSNYDGRYSWSLHDCPDGGCAWRKPQIASPYYDSTFKLHLENRTEVPITYTLLKSFQNCYRGDKAPGSRFGPVPPGGRATMTLTRGSRYACIGEQAEFAVKLNDAQYQRFSYNSFGRLKLTNRPTRFISRLSPKSRYDGSYIWAAKSCPDGGCPAPPTIIGARSGEQGYARIFRLDLKNGLQKPVTFSISREHHNCYEGTPRIGSKLGPIAPGGKTSLTLARIQSNDCTGRQGEFAIHSSGYGELQRFSFDNAGHLGLSSFPDAYFGRLSSKSAYDESYEWELQPPDKRVPHSRTYLIQHAVSKNYLIQGYRGGRDDKRNVEVAGLAPYDNNYRWYIRPAKDGWQNIINVKTGLALTWDGNDANVSNWGLAPHPDVEPLSTDRRFDLHVVNRTSQPVTFYMSNKWGNCYEGDMPVGDFRGPLAPGGRFTIKLARVQGHGCDGKQGEFEIKTDKFAEPQRFSFDNAGGLDLVDSPRGFRSKLSPKSRTNGSYTWTMHDCLAGGCKEVLEVIAHPIGNHSQQWKFNRQADGSFEILNRGANRDLQQAYSGGRADKPNVTVDGGGRWFIRPGGNTDLARLTIESVKAIKTSTGQDTGTQILFAGIEAAIEAAISATGAGSAAVGAFKAAGSAAKTAGLKGLARVGSKSAAKKLAERGAASATKATAKGLKSIVDKAAQESAEQALKNSGKRVWVEKTRSFAQKHVASQLTAKALKKRVRNEFTKEALAKRAIKTAVKKTTLAAGNAATEGPDAKSLTELAFNQIYGESPDQLDIHVNGVSVWPNGGRDWRSIKSQQTRAVNTEYIFPRRQGLALRLVEYDSGSADDTLGWVFLDTYDIVKPMRFEDVVAYSKAERSFYLITFRVEPLEMSAMMVEARKERDKQRARAKARAEQAALAKAKAAYEAKIRAEAEARVRAEYETRLKAEAEARTRAEYEARLKAEAEARARAEYEAKLKAEAEARARAEYAARLKAEAEAAARARAQAEYAAQLRAQREAQLRAQREAQLRAQREAQLRAQREARWRAERQRQLRDQMNRRNQGNDHIRRAPRTAASSSVSPDFTMVASHSGKCIEASGDISVVQTACSGDMSQRFAMRKIGQYVSIIARGNGDCLELSGADRNDNAPVSRGPCNGQPQQQFRVQKTGPGAFHIIARHSGKCFDIPGGDRSDYAPLNQFTCDSSAEQTFRLNRIGGG